MTKHVKHLLIFGMIIAMTISFVAIVVVLMFPQTTEVADFYMTDVISPNTTRSRYEVYVDKNLSEEECKLIGGTPLEPGMGAYSGQCAKRYIGKVDPNTGELLEEGK
ncbi:hypothetical protein FWF48_03185 [Candidatus Saccharibacteria bacterium]|nr:hypothetical protein [Candidatus Saccharibacteria bacterium]